MSTRNSGSVPQGPRHRDNGDWLGGPGAMPRPRTWSERPDLIGQTVVPHTCHAEPHGDRIGCICELLGRPVVITRIYKTSFASTPAYHVAGSAKLLWESEFSEETRGTDPDIVEGFILEGPNGMYLGAHLRWVEVEGPLEGYLHNTQMVRALLGGEIKEGLRPVRAYPARSRADGTEKQIMGEQIPFDELEL